jgi:E3 ubiquitin-protein ligase MARCH6
MAAAAAAPPETALPAAVGPAYDDEDDEEEQCRICRFPAAADRPLRHPCACHGSIRFVHDDCQFRWMAIRRLQRCEVSSPASSSYGFQERAPYSPLSAPPPSSRKSGHHVGHG